MLSDQHQFKPVQVPMVYRFDLKFSFKYVEVSDKKGDSRDGKTKTIPHPKTRG